MRACVGVTVQPLRLAARTGGLEGWADQQLSRVPAHAQTGVLQ